MTAAASAAGRRTASQAEPACEAEPGRNASDAVSAAAPCARATHTHTQTHTHTHKIVRRAISYVEQNITEPVTLCELERVTKCSAFQIIRAFRSEVGTTPHAYIIASSACRSGRCSACCPASAS